MKTTIIPGYSISNKQWAEETADKLNRADNKTEVYYWKHWADNKTPVLGNAQEIVRQIGEGGGNVVAKSIGTLALAYVLPRVKESINKIILCGLPLNDISGEDKEIYKALSGFDAKRILVIQNSEDKHGTYDEVREFLKNINPEIKIISKQSDTHDYPYFNDFLQFLKIS